MEITTELDRKCDALVSQYPRKKSAAMMIMHAIQETNGYFDDDAVRYAAKKLGIEPIDVYGMLSFYPMYSTSPRGRVHIKVCRTLSCAMLGSVKLAHAISKKTGCPIGSTKGVYTLEFVECLGNCANGPSVQVNDRLFGRIAAEEAEKFVEKLEAMDAAGELTPRPADSPPAGGDDFDSPSYNG